MLKDGPDPTNSLGVNNLELLTLNLARMVEQAGKAASAYLKPREEGKKSFDVDGTVNDAVKTLARVAEFWLSDPERTLDAQRRLFTGYVSLWAYELQRMMGEPGQPVVTPDPRDKRFTDPDWSKGFFAVVKDLYLVTSHWVEELVEDAKNLDPHTRQKALFYVRQVVSALAPSNFVATNPELLRETLASDGENLVRGMRMLAEDIQAGGGDLKIRQTAGDSFRLGKTIANTKGKVVFQNELCQLIQYQPTTETVLKRPLLIVPPWINKFYILDLNPEKSFVRWCVDQGHTVFVISWVNPDRKQAEKGFDDYMRQGVLAALDVVEDITGADGVNTVGYCVGGTLLAVALAYAAATRDTRIKSATLFATQVDFTHAGDLSVFVDEEQIAAVEKSMSVRGYLEGRKMAAAFNMLRPNDLIWPYVISNYFKGKEPAPFDLLYWNSDTTRMPAANHSFYLRNCYLDNNLAKGRIVIDNRRLDLKKAGVPIYNLATREDHIAPPRSVFYGSSFFGGPVTFVLAGSGHIAGVINPPSRDKYQYWTGEAPQGDRYEAWLRRAKEHQGSWWPHWQAWIEALDSERVKPRKVGNRKHKAIEPAPGSYVAVRA
jgi:polyhydroxyalkanoate synthase